MLSVSLADEVTEWGLQVGDTRFSFNSLYPLTQTRQMTCYTNGREDQQISYAYALYNGTYLLSDPETIYFDYRPAEIRSPAVIPVVRIRSSGFISICIPRMPALIKIES